MHKRSRKRWLLWVAIAIGMAIFGLYIILPFSFGVAAILPAQTTVGSPPDGFTDTTFVTQDGVSLAGWYKPTANGAVILLLHGAGGSREDVRPYAELLARHGYGVLAFDQRGHGSSGGKTNRLGWQGTQDIGAAIKSLQALPEIERIGGLGLSMGGEALLGAAAEYPALSAIVADGATRRSTQELLALPSERSLVRNFTARVMYAAVQVLSGEKSPAPLLEAMVASPATKFLLIAGGANNLEVAFNELFADTLGEQATLWIAPDTPHTGAFIRFPQEYEQRVIAFFDEALLGNSR